MRFAFICTFITVLSGCATTQTTPADHTSVAEFSYAIAYSDRIWSNRPMREPVRTSGDSMNTIQFLSDSYGERILERLDEFCRAKGLFPSNRIKSAYGAAFKPTTFLQGLDKIERHTRSREVFTRPGEPPKVVGGQLKSLYCAREEVDVSSPHWQEVEWFAFAIPKPYYSQTGSSWTTRYEFFIAERKSQALVPFISEVSDFLLTF